MRRGAARPAPPLSFRFPLPAVSSSSALHLASFFIPLADQTHLVAFLELHPDARIQASGRSSILQVVFVFFPLRSRLPDVSILLRPATPSQPVLFCKAQPRLAGGLVLLACRLVLILATPLWSKVHPAGVCQIILSSRRHTPSPCRHLPSRWWSRNAVQKSTVPWLTAAKRKGQSPVMSRQQFAMRSSVSTVRRSLVGSSTQGMLLETRH